MDTCQMLSQTRRSEIPKKDYWSCRCIPILAYLVSWRALGRSDFPKCVASRGWASWQVAIQPYFLDVDVLALSGER